MSSSPFGRQLRQWRRVRGVSQLQLSVDSGVSTRHISFLETGRSRPGRKTLLQLAETLKVPPRQCNELLRAAGLPALYPEHDFADEEMEPFRNIIGQLLRNHEPYPALVFDRWWNIVETNAGARAMAGEFVPGAGTIIDLVLGDPRWRQITENFDEVAWALVARIRRDMVIGGPDPKLVELLERAEGYLKDVPPPVDDPSSLMVCPRLRLGGRTVRTVSTIARFGTARDVTLNELRVDLLFPADRESEEFFIELRPREAGVTTGAGAAILSDDGAR